jgi:hypothetical protein
VPWQGTGKQDGPLESRAHGVPVNAAGRSQDPPRRSGSNLGGSNSEGSTMDGSSSAESCMRCPPASTLLLRWLRARASRRSCERVTPAFSDTPIQRATRAGSHAKQVPDYRMAGYLFVFRCTQFAPVDTWPGIPT